MVRQSEADRYPNIHSSPCIRKLYFTLQKNTNLAEDITMANSNRGSLPCEDAWCGHRNLTPWADGALPWWPGSSGWCSVGPAPGDGYFCNTQNGTAFTTRTLLQTPCLQTLHTPTILAATEKLQMKSWHTQFRVLAKRSTTHFILFDRKVIFQCNLESAPLHCLPTATKKSGHSYDSNVSFYKNPWCISTANFVNYLIISAVSFSER